MKEARFYVATISVFPKDVGLFKELVKRFSLDELIFPLVDVPTASATFIMDNKKILSEYFVARLGRKAVRDYPLHDEVDGFRKVKSEQYPYSNIIIDTKRQLAYFEYEYSLNYDVNRFLAQFDTLINKFIAEKDYEIRSSVKTDKAALEEKLRELIRIKHVHYALLPPNRVSHRDLKELLYAARAAGANQRVDLDLAAKGNKASIDRDAPLIKALDTQVSEGGGSATYSGYDEKGNSSTVKTKDTPKKKRVASLKKIEEMTDQELDTFLRERLAYGEE